MRSKQSIKYYESRIAKLFEAEPNSKLVAYRYRTLRYLLLENYPMLEEIGKETVLNILRDTVYLDRKLRLETEGLEEEEKEVLSQTYQLEMLK